MGSMTFNNQSGKCLHWAFLCVMLSVPSQCHLWVSKQRGRRCTPGHSQVSQYYQSWLPLTDGTWDTLPYMLHQIPDIGTIINVFIFIWNHLLYFKVIRKQLTKVSFLRDFVSVLWYMRRVSLAPYVLFCTKSWQCRLVSAVVPLSPANILFVQNFVQATKSEKTKYPHYRTFVRGNSETETVSMSWSHPDIQTFI